ELLDAAAEDALDHLGALRDQAQLLANRERGLADAIEREPAPAETESPETAPSAEDSAATGERFDELAGRQTDLLTRAVGMAVSAAEAGSDAAEDIANAAREASNSLEALEAGDLEQASAAAQRAAQLAEQTAATAPVIDAEQGGENLLPQFAADQH